MPDSFRYLPDSTFYWLPNLYQARAIRIGKLPFMYYDSVRSDAHYEDPQATYRSRLLDS
jgi:hypothetical protein